MNVFINFFIDLFVWENLMDVYWSFWDWIFGFGNWWIGVEWVVIVVEVCGVCDCEFCVVRK